MTKSAIAAALVIPAAAFFIGCSGSGKPTTPEPTAAEEYEEFSEDIRDFVGSMVDFVVQDYDDFEDFDPTATPPLPMMGKVALDTTVEMDTVYENGWYIFTASVEDSTGIISIADSIRFVDITGAAQQFPSAETTNAIYLKEHAAITLIIPDFGMSWTFTVDGDFSFVGFQSAVVVANGSAEYGMNIAGSTDYGPTTIDLIYEVGINEVTVSNPQFGGNGCVTGGSFTIDFAAIVDGYDEDGKRVNESVDAVITVTFNSGGSAYYTVNIDGQIFTEVIDGCGDY